MTADRQTARGAGTPVRLGAPVRSPAERTGAIDPVTGAFEATLDVLLPQSFSNFFDDCIWPGNLIIVGHNGHGDFFVIEAGLPDDDPPVVFVCHDPPGLSYAATSLAAFAAGEDFSDGAALIELS